MAPKLSCYSGLDRILAGGSPMTVDAITGIPTK